MKYNVILEVSVRRVEASSEDEAIAIVHKNLCDHKHDEVGYIAWEHQDLKYGITGRMNR